MKLPQLSIRATVLAVIMVAVLVPLAVWWYAERSLIREAYEPLMAQNRQAVLGLTAAALVEPLWTIDERAVGTAAQRALNDVSVLSVRLTERRPGAVPLLLLKPAARPDEGLRLHTVISREGEMLGELEIWFDPQQINRLLAQRRTAAIQLAALQLVLCALVLSWVVYRRLLNPIAILKAQASQIALRGEFTPQTWSRRDELGELGQHLNDVHGQIHQLFGQLEQQQGELAKLALHDALTGLPNRLLFGELLQNAVAATLRDGTELALLFVDLDRFKAVNDTLGHAAGDELLVAVAQRLTASVRASDVVCRYSGDEFLVLLPDAGTIEQLAASVDRLQKSVAAPCMMGGREVQISASVGIALFPADAHSADELIRHADMAMYEAKRLGRSRHSFFRAEFNDQVQSQLCIERELALALAREEFVLHYQPQVSADGGVLLGFEALIRWQHPQRGLVPPLEFIGVAEQSGLIGAIGAWAVGEACAQIERWKAAGFAFGRVAVNVSGAEFHDQKLIDTITAAMGRHGVRPHELEIEITESVLMSDGSGALRIVAGLQSLGLRLAIDDFGTGYSSLAYLKRLRPHTIKIDRSFLVDLPDDEDDRVVVLAILGLAQALGIEVVAEGVETAGQSDFLRAAGCDVLQGYLIGRPCEPGAIEVWARDRGEGADAPPGTP